VKIPPRIHKAIKHIVTFKEGQRVYTSDLKVSNSQSWLEELGYLRSEPFKAVRKAEALEFGAYFKYCGGVLKDDSKAYFYTGKKEEDGPLDTV